MRGKSEKAERKGRGVAVVASVGNRFGKKEAEIGAKSNSVMIQGNQGKASGNGRLEEVGFGVNGVLKPWTFQASGHRHGNDRGQVPPPLPVPIASFII